MDKVKREISILKPQTFCVNNLEDSETEEMTQFLSDLYPQKAPWEC